MTNVKSQPAHLRGKAVSRDKYGRPKVPENKLKEFWPFLTDEDKQYLLEKYHGNYAPDGP